MVGKYLPRPVLGIHCTSFHCVSSAKSLIYLLPFDLGCNKEMRE